MRAAAQVAAIGRHTLTRTMEAVVLLAIIATLTLGLALATGQNPGADSVFARKGGGGGKPGGHNSTSATLVVTPNPVAAGGASFTVSGSGYGANKIVAVALANPGCCLAFNVGSDANGRIAFTKVTNLPGTYYVRTYAYGTSTLLATTSFVVQ